MAIPSTISLLLLGVLAFVVANAIGEPSRKVSDLEKCNKNVIEIHQSPVGTLPNGIPLYGVEIANTCLSGCNVSNIHLSCGSFSSAILINPRIFKRLRYNDCLVNNAQSLPNGHILSFRYANTYPYALSVSFVFCG
ncbi:hypothetical protein VNO77_34288 [Canavalia gladiata]|uniref:Uncharacterized protein n=1 Tax=Canavalia gladiata TaxID=3824 RepID=A0AAN9KET4_CANGL